MPTVITVIAANALPMIIHDDDQDRIELEGEPYDHDDDSQQHEIIRFHMESFLYCTRMRLRQCARGV